MSDRPRFLTLKELDELIAFNKQQAGRQGLAAKLHENEAEEDRERAGQKDELAALAREAGKDHRRIVRELEERRSAIRPRRGAREQDIGKTRREHIRKLYAENPEYTELELARLAGTTRHQVRKELGRKVDYRSPGSVDKSAGNANRTGSG